MARAPSAGNPPTPYILAPRADAASDAIDKIRPMTPISRNEGVSGSSPLIGFGSQSQIAPSGAAAIRPRATIAPLQRTPGTATWMPRDPLGAALLALIVGLVLALVVTYDPSAARAQSSPTSVAGTRKAPPIRWVPATLSHYGTCTYVNVAQGCDGYLGKRTACGKTVRTTSTFVAALKPSLAHCHMRLTIWYRGRKYHTRVEDRGAWRSDSRALDAAPGLRAAMGFDGVARIKYAKGWR